MANYTIYHNPRCSKSRQTLELLTDAGVPIHIIEYLKSPPSEQQLSDILKALHFTPQELMRKKEAEYKDAGLNDNNLSDSEQIQRMIAHPKVIERPIVIKTEALKSDAVKIIAAVIGRPPEKVKLLF